MSIQQDVIDCIGPNGIAVKELRARMGNVPQLELDTCTNALLLSKKIHQSLGRFTLVPTKPPVLTVSSEPELTAMEEAAASLNTSIHPEARHDVRICKRCLALKAINEFRFLQTIGPDVRADTCNACHGEQIKTGLPKLRGQPAKESAVDTVMESVKAQQAADIATVARLQVHIEEREILLRLYGKYAAGSL